MVSLSVLNRHRFVDGLVRAFNRTEKEANEFVLDINRIEEEIENNSKKSQANKVEDNDNLESNARELEELLNEIKSEDSE